MKPIKARWTVCAMLALLCFLGTSGAAHAQTLLSISPSFLPGGDVGVAYSQTLTVSSNTNGPYTWSVDPALPAGLTLTPSPSPSVTAVLSGTPQVAGSSQFTISVSSNSAFGSQLYFTFISLPPTIATASPLPTGIVGTSYSQLLSISGGNSPFTVSLAGGTLPPGLTIGAILPCFIECSPVPALTGTPTTGGTFNFTLMVTDSVNGSSTKAFTLTIIPQLLFTTSSPLPTGEVGGSYSTAVNVTGGISPYTWSLGQGSSLPPGLLLNTSNGLISGTPTTAGTFTFTIQVLDSGPVTTCPPSNIAACFPINLQQLVSATFSLTIAPPVRETTLGLASGTVGSSYSAVLAATGGIPPYTWSVLAGQLPPGLTLNGLTGLISGTAGAAGDFNFTVQVTDSAQQKNSRAFTISITVPSLNITTASPLPAGTAGASYLQLLSATGGQPGFSWSLAEGSLPSGLSLNSGGSLAGTPATQGTSNFTVQVTDTRGLSTTKQFTLEIRPAPLAITTSSPLQGGSVGNQSTWSFTATGGVPPYAWAVSGGTIPPGVTFASNAPNGVLSGTPNSSGTFSFTVQVGDSLKTVVTKDFTLTIGVAGLSITNSSPLPSGTVGSPYSASVNATGGAKPYTWSADSLPAGLTIQTVNDAGEISGAPTSAGTFNFTVRVADSKGGTASKSFEITIQAATLTITTSSPLSGGAAGSGYGPAPFSATGGKNPYVWKVTAGSLPGGMAFSTLGELSGTPASAGSFSFTVQVADAQGLTAAKDFSLTIAGSLLSITTASPLSGGLVGSSYTVSLSAAGGTLSYSWSADSLPAGLTINSRDNAGVISGVPTSPGRFSFSATVTDRAGATARKSFSLTIDAPPSPAVTISGMPDIVDPATQSTIQLGLDGPYPLPISGQVTLTFASDSGVDDPAIQFATGGRQAPFTIPSGDTQAMFSVPNLGVQTGTVAGTINIVIRLQVGDTDITPVPPPSLTIRVDPLPPVITSVKVTRTASGFDVQITGLSTPREVTEATFRFTAVPGGNLQTTDFTMPADAVFAKWYQDPVSANFGSNFSFTKSFAVQGDASVIASVTVTLANKQGNSQPVTANF